MLHEIAVATQTEIVTITEAAANALMKTLQDKGMSADDYALRVFIKGGGCSGYQYGMALEPNPRETDFVVEERGVRIVIDEVSLDYLHGSQIDYVDDMLAGKGFKIDNPNAVATCGCGSSFRTKESGAPAASSGGGSCGCGH